MKKVNCQHCNKVYSNEWIDYYDKHICYDCMIYYCGRCQTKLNIDANDIDRCKLCELNYCSECPIIECDICLHSNCTRCFGSVVQISCMCFVCIGCIIFEDDRLRYTKDKNYVCDMCYDRNKDKYELSEMYTAQDIYAFISKNEDMIFPKLDEYMHFMIKNPHYRGIHFM